MATDNHIIKSPKITISASDDNDLWNKEWIITLTGKDEKIGTVTFAGVKVLGTIPIHVELDEPYRNKGLGTQAFIMMVDWAFRFSNIYEVTAVTDRENDKCVKALGKAGFVYRSEEGRMATYSITKAKTAWLGLYLFLGIAVGLVLGIIFQHVIAGMIVGVVIGISIGASLDIKANKERQKVTGKMLR